MQRKSSIFTEKLDYLAMLVVFIFVGFRDKVGGDWEGYYNLLINCSEGKYFAAVEPIFVIVMKLSLLVGSQYQYTVFNCLMCLILLLSTKYFLTKFSNKSVTLTQLITLIYPIFMFLFATGYLRQAIASTFILAVFYELKDKNYIKSLLFILLAAGFHKSSAIFLVLPFFFYIYQEKNIKLSNFVNWGQRDKITLLLLAMIFTAISYVYAEDYLNQSMHSYGIIIRILYVLILSLPLILNYKDELLSHIKKHLLFHIFATVAVIPVVILFSTFLDRILFYLFLPLAFGVIKLMTSGGLVSMDKEKKTYYLLIMMFLNTVYVYVWLKYSYWGTLKWIPYSNNLFQ